MSGIATESVFSGLQSVLANGGLDQVMGLFSGNAAVNDSNPLVGGIMNQFVGTIMDRLGIESSAAKNIAMSLIPMVLGKLVSKTNDANDNQFDINNILGTLIGGKSNHGGAVDLPDRNQSIDFSGLLSKVTQGGDMDIDGDGLDEIISTQASYQNGNPDDGIKIYEADGTSTRLSYDNANSLQTTDWDGDGIDDLIAVGDDFGIDFTIFIAQGANDSLIGCLGDDTITGGRGDDELTGGGGGDTFHFAAAFDDDTITDFETGADILSFTNVAGISTIQDVLTAVSVVGSDSVVTFNNGDTITLEGITGLTSGDVLVV